MSLYLLNFVRAEALKLFHIVVDIHVQSRLDSRAPNYLSRQQGHLDAHCGRLARHHAVRIAGIAEYLYEQANAAFYESAPIYGI